MGTIVKRGTRARPRYYIQYRELDDRLKMRAVPDARTREDAAKELARVEGRVASGKRGLEEKDTRQRGPLIDDWLASLSNRNAQDDRSRVKRDVQPAWAESNLQVAQKLSSVMRWLDQLKKSGLSGQSQRHALNAFSRFMAWAVARGYAEVNPCRQIPQGARPQSAAKQADAPWLRDEKTFAKLVAALPSPFSLMFWLCNRSGLRLGEVCGLVMEDFDWLGDGIIRVGRSYDGPLKEDKGNGAAPKVKWVPAAIDTGDVIGPWLAARKKAGATSGDLVFPRPARRPGGVGTARRRLKRRGRRRRAWSASR